MTMLNDPPAPPIPPQADVRIPKDGDDEVREQDGADNALESIGKAVTAPIIESADPSADEPAEAVPDAESPKPMAPSKKRAAARRAAKR